MLLFTESHLRELVDGSSPAYFREKLASEAAFETSLSCR